MKRLVVGTVVSALLAACVWIGLPALTAQVQSDPCVIDGAEFPELMPEYAVWETHFRSLVGAALGDNFEGKEPNFAGPLQTGVIRNLARYNGLTEHDLGTALRIGQKAILKYDALAAAHARLGEPSEVETRARRAAAVDVILDARDEIIRALPPAASRALRRSAPAKGSKFHFPPAR